MIKRLLKRFRKPERLEIDDLDAVTLEDAQLAHQMGFIAAIQDGRLLFFVKED